MATGINPFPQTPQMTGMLAGFYDAARYNYGTADLERQFRDADLKNLMDQNTYDEAIKDKPLKEVERTTKTKQNLLDQSLIDDGTKRRGVEAELEGKQLSNAQQKLINNGLEIQEGARQLNEFMQLPNAAKIAGWDQYMEQLKKAKVKVPEGGFSQANLDVLGARNQAAINTVQQLQALQKVEHEKTLQGGLDYLNNKSREGIAARHDATLRSTAAITAAAKKQQPLDRDAYQQAAIEMKNNGGVADLNTVIKAGALTTKEEPLRKEYFAAFKTAIRNDSATKRDKPLTEEQIVDMANEMTEKKIQEIQLQNGYDNTGSKVTKAGLEQIRKVFPKVATRLEQQGKVVTGPGASEGAAPPGVGANAPVQAVSPATREARIQSAMKQNPGVPRAQVEQELIAVGYIPAETTPAPQQAPAQPAPPPQPRGEISGPPSGTDVINRQLMGKFADAVTDPSANAGVAGINKRILNSLGL